jgi:predicted nucleic acid-binding protein
LSLLILDASVAIQWAVPSAAGPFTGTALQLLKDHVDGKVEFVVPEIFWAEVANALCKGVRQRRWKREDAEEGIADLAGYNFDTVPTLLLLTEALPITLDFGLSLYDCLYVALAMQAKADLITADERLANALAARFPVKWLGAFG